MKKVVLILLCTSVVLFSCKKDKGDGIDKTYDTGRFVEENGVKATVFPFKSSDLPKEFTLPGGTKITIPANILFTKNGTAVSGDFTLEAREFFTLSDMVFSGVNTNYKGAQFSGNGTYLITDGFINLKVKNNGTYVDELLNGGFITISVPAGREDGSTMIWQGEEQDDGLEWGDLDEGAWNWQNNKDEGLVNITNGSFIFDFGKLGWINCDVFMSSSEGLTTVTVKLTGKAGKLAQYMGTDGDTYVFFAGKGIKVVAQLYTQLNTSTVQSYINSMPVGLSGRLIAFSVKEGECSYAAKDITVSEDQDITLDLQPIDREELQKRIKALDTFN